MGLLHILPRLKFFCCCFDLRTGALIMGVLELLSSLGTTERTFTLVGDLEHQRDVLRANGVKPEDMDKRMSEVGPVLLYSFANALIGLVLSLLLLVGAYQRNMKMLAVYLYIHIVAFGFLAILVIVSLFVIPQLSIVPVLWLAFIFYIFFCINSYYLLLEEEQKNRQSPAVIMRQEVDMLP